MSERKSYKILDAQAATGTSLLVDVRDFDKITFAIVTATGSTLEYKFQGAIDLPEEGVGNPVDFSAASSVTNPWDYLDVIDVEDGASIDGDTGVSITTTAETRLFTVNVEGLSYVAITVTARSAGSITAWAEGYNYHK